ncbi:MAG: MBL fold metallo-hydrolase, partial [Myxococcota bacterium]
AMMPAAGIMASRYLVSPPEPPESLAAVPPVHPVNAGGVIAFLIAPEGQPVTLINSGNDPKAAALLAKLTELGRKPSDVKAIVLNHGSYDHWAGHSQFPNAVLYAGAEDLELVDHARRIESKAPKLHMRVFGRPGKHRRLRTVVPSGLLRFGSIEIDCIPLPGVTKGSMAYRWQDVLFVGDSLWPVDDRRAPRAPPPTPWLEKPKHLPTVLKRLDRHPTRWLATSREGLVSR